MTQEATLWIQGRPAPRREYSERVAAHARRWRGEVPWDQLVECWLHFRIRVLHRKDLDNLTKVVLDGLMAGGLLKDDRWVYALHVLRTPVAYDADEGLAVRLIWPLDGERFSNLLDMSSLREIGPAPRLPEETS